MTTDEFVMWMKEFVEKTPNKKFDKKQIAVIKKKMKEVKTIVNNNPNGGVILSC